MAALRGRLSKLSEASLRINESLDFETVLEGVLDSARSLIGSRYGAITLLDDAGQIQDFVTPGLTTEDGRQPVELPDRMLFFETFGSLEAPLRLRDFHSHIRSLGLPEFRQTMAVSSPLRFLAVPVRYRGEAIGAMYVCEKDQEFTPEDEESLVIFASLAALVITNARRRREEQRARTDFETLVNTAPVGVLVLDAGTGDPVSLNREARRIVSDLCMPGGSAEELCEVVTFRRADGREISLHEFPLVEVLNASETVLAEEIVLHAPNGRSVTTLVNATPVLSREGEVESVVVTLQDMTSVEELRRLRSEFLPMVSHKLSTPLTSIKWSTDTLLDAASDLDSAETAQFLRIIRDQADDMRYLISDLLDVARLETGTLRVAPEPTAVVALVDGSRNRFQSGGGRNSLHIDIPPELPPIMADRRRIIQVISNLLSNAARHSHRSAAIRVKASREGVHVAISVSDNGAGVTPERLCHLFGTFSRLEGWEQSREMGERGLGLAICRRIVEAHGGRIWAESDGPGMGSHFTFTIPAV